MIASRFFLDLRLRFTNPTLGTDLRCNDDTK